MSDIIRAAGVTEAILFHYFGNKADLFAVVFERSAPTASYREIIEGTRPVPVAEALRRLSQEYLQMVHKRRPFVVTLLSGAAVEPGLARLRSRFPDEVLAGNSALLARRQERGEIGPDVNATAGARAFQGGLTFHVTSTVFQPDTDRDGIDDVAVVEGLVAVLLSGLAARGSVSGKEGTPIELQRS